MVGPVVAVASVLVTGLLGWAGIALNRRAQRATERNQAHDQDDRTFARMKDLVEIFDRKFTDASQRLTAIEKERETERQERAADRVELDEMHRSVVALQGKVQRLEGRLIKAVTYIRDLLGLLVGQGIAHPPIPDEIAHLFDTKPPGGTP